MPAFIDAQVTLEANGPGQTYELINSVLAPGYTAVETPDQCASHPSFGRHIAEVWDATLNKYVFEFYIHVPTTFPVTTTTADNDRCMNFDRQRVEIKTYESSPANLKGTVGETVTYKWKFRLPTEFQPSPNFSHIHQIKAVGGDEVDPIFTLTARYGTSSNSLQLLYVFDSSNAANTLVSKNLNEFLGTWVNVTEVINIGTNGTYSITINKESDGSNIFSYTNSNIRTIRPSNTFIRPKWGIYRSLNSPAYLRDDSIRIASVSIQEGVLPVTVNNFKATALDKNILLQWSVQNEINFDEYQIEYSNSGNEFSKIGNIKASGLNTYEFVCHNTEKKQFYRLKLIDKSGSYVYSNIISLVSNRTNTFLIYPNPTKNSITLYTNENSNQLSIVISNSLGKEIKKIALLGSSINISTKEFLNGFYHIQLIKNNQIINQQTLIITH